ncbi:MAG: TRAP transporter small permease subunit [Acidobacteriota bacterium]|nr:TRAP transporter small permease subunit [Acidobacteriota bacterium]
MTDRPAATLRKRFQQFLEILMLTLMAALAIVVLVGVGFRKAGAALVWYDEVASILLAWLTYYGASLAALKRAHIGFPKLVDDARPRVRIALNVFREIVVVGFFVLVAWAGWRVMQILDGVYLASLPSVPTRLTQSVIPIGAVLFIVAELLSFAELWPWLQERKGERKP